MFLFQFNTYDPSKIHSHPGVRNDLFNRPLEQALITDFFGSVAQVEISPVVVLDEDLPSPLSSSEPATSTPPGELSLTSLLSSSNDVVLEQWNRQTRTWGSIAALACLIGWATVHK